MNNLKIKSKLRVKRIFKKFGFQVSKIPYEKSSSNELIEIKIGDHKIHINGKHQLPMYMQNPFYSTNLPRLAKKVKGKYNNLIMIDVGANVGDTVAFVRNKTNCPIVCIEGDNDFFRILKKNLKKFDKVHSFQYILGEKNGSEQASLKKNDDSSETARIQKTHKFINLITLDNFFTKNKEFSKAKLLKIDTDGYDLKIIRGGLDYIKKTKPILFFEYDTIFLEEHKDDGISTLKLLENLGYKNGMFYDNQGKFILSFDLSNHLLIKQMHNLIDKNYRVPFPFYDIVLFHEEDNDIAKKFIKDEMNFFYT